MKKVVLLLLLLAGTFSLAFSQQSGTCGENVVWTYSDSTLTIKPAEGTSGGAMEGYTIFTGDRPWDYLDISKVIIEEGVTSIGIYAFFNCTGLTSVTIPNSVTSIGSAAFSDCRGLTSVTIPESVTSIGIYAFSRCSGLTSVTIPNSVTFIGKNAFENCSGLTSVTIPNSVTAIRDRTFAYCIRLTSVTIPESVTYIEDYAFEDCSGLKEIIKYGDPIYLGKHSFDGVGVYVTKVQLVVPAGCGAAYQQAAVWRDFQIVEIPFAPEFSEKENVLTCGTRVSIVSASSDAVIYYGIGKDAEPTLLYEESIAVTDTTYICAFAQRGEAKSEVVRVTYFANHASSLTAHEAVAPTCEEGRKAYWECQSCSKLFSDAEATEEIAEPEVIEALGHDLTAHETVASTCTEEGRKAYWECGRCEKLFSDAEATEEISEPEVIEALGHDLTAHEEVAATCTEEGRKAYWECGRCQKLFSDAEATTEISEPEVIEALGHDLTAHEAVAATCTEEGRKAYWECGRCQKLFSDAEATTEIAEPVKIAAQGHSYGQPVWVWTEDYRASVSFTCIRCSHEENPKVTVRSEITRPATATMEGERTYTATTVFEGETYTDTKTEVIEAEQTASEATALVRGVKIYPNPSRGEFKVELPVDAQVEIFDASGRKVLAQPCSAGTHGFSLAQAGMYALKVSTSGQQAVFRLVVR